ncbi:AAA family ATPase [Gordonia sp. 'Campus']|uniref:AAA family ATPase n=1 Tax=Gordonia sp. 'Campus' TaxID=2915824 RepID=UPI001EE4EABF|nr:AAA family ATPase [Gordonia sp. 'Campus']
MLVWINGAFGAGKTHTAHELHRRLASSHVADPELIGFAIHRMLPSSERKDFQDRPQWRAAVVETLVQAERVSDGPVIVPMTLVDDRYFDEIVGGLQARGVDVRHYALTASSETIRRRLRTRAGAVFGRVMGMDETWAMQQTERCVAALAGDRYATHISNDARSLDDVVEDIAAHAGLDLIRPRPQRIRALQRRVAVSIAHIR